MIGQKFDKPLQDDYIYNPETGEREENPAPNTYKKYAECASWCNANDAHIEDKESYYEAVKNEPYVPTIQDRVAELKAKLAETDYCVIKIAEGEATKEQCAHVLEQRKAWREEINALENN